MAISFDALSRDIREQSFSPVPFPLNRADLQSAIDAFFAFLALPQEIKEPIYFQLNPGQRGNEVGYKLYRRELGHTDNREYVHYNEHADERFQTVLTTQPEFQRLVGSMKEVYSEAKKLMEEIVLHFDVQYPGFHEKLFPKGEKPLFFLRFLKYDPADPTKFLAKGHYDRGICTLAIAESAPGLRIGRTDQDVRPVIHHEGQALFFPGIRMPEFTSNDFVPAWHDVVQQGSDQHSDTVARWAMVFFASAASETPVTYEAAHTPRY